MTDKTTQIIERLHAELGDRDGERPAGSEVTIAAADARLLLTHLGELKRDKEELRRQAARGSEMIDAASLFLKAYGEKYRNFASGGIRPTAILLNEVKVMWAVLREFRTLTEKEQ